VRASGDVEGGHGVEHIDDRRRPFQLLEQHGLHLRDVDVVSAEVGVERDHRVRSAGAAAQYTSSTDGVGSSNVERKPKATLP
jgi:hypothetical protein